MKGGDVKEQIWKIANSVDNISSAVGFLLDWSVHLLVELQKQLIRRNFKHIFTNIYTMSFCKTIQIFKDKVHRFSEIPQMILHLQHSLMFLSPHWNQKWISKKHLSRIHIPNDYLHTKVDANDAKVSWCFRLSTSPQLLMGDDDCGKAHKVMCTYELAWIQGWIVNDCGAGNVIKWMLQWTLGIDCR